MKKGNLLIVDDEKILLKRLRLNLEDFADQVFTAENGQEALAVVESEQIDCILCDINMPVLNGVEVIKKLRENQNDVPFIFYTGHGNSELMLEAASYGAFDFLNKPSLVGIEDVVTRGLHQGVTKVKVSSSEESQSEFQKMLLDIEKDS